MFVLDEMRKEAVVNLKREDYVVICLKEMRWTTVPMGQDSLYTGTDRTGHLPGKSQKLCRLENVARSIQSIMIEWL